MGWQKNALTLAEVQTLKRVRGLDAKYLNKQCSKRNGKFGNLRHLRSRKKCEEYETKINQLIKRLPRIQKNKHKATILFNDMFGKPLDDVLGDLDRYVDRLKNCNGHFSLKQSLELQCQLRGIDIAMLASDGAWICLSATFGYRPKHGYADEADKDQDIE